MSLTLVSATTAVSRWSEQLSEATRPTHTRRERMRNRSLRSYQRLHRGEHAVETEQSKIAREGETYAKQAR